MANMTKYKNDYNKQNYCRISLVIPKEKKQVIEDLAESEHKSKNQLIINAIEKYYNVDLTIVESKLIGGK